MLKDEADELERLSRIRLFYVQSQINMACAPFIPLGIPHASRADVVLSSMRGVCRCDSFTPAGYLFFNSFTFDRLHNINFHSELLKQ